ncbi:MAG: amidohydrolase [Planctomycetota bacterium]
MRAICKFIVAACALVAHDASAQSTSLQDLAGSLVAPPGNATIYAAREILTMNPKKPRAQAVAIQDGRFVAVGTVAQVEAATGKGAKIDKTFVDKVLVAGFVEQHVHPVLAALTMNTKVISIEDWDAIDGFSPAARDETTYQDRLQTALAAHADNSKPFVTWGYHHYFHGGMSRAMLDKLAPDFPVIVWHRSCHEFYLNSAALKQTGIDAALVAGFTQGQKDQLDFEKGHFFEQGAMAVLGKLAPILASPAQFKSGLEFTEAYYHRAGITVACEPGGFFSKPMQEMINSVYSDDATPFNHYFIADGKSFAARNPKDAKALVKDTQQVLSWGQGRTRYLPKQVKLLTDGAIYSQLMMMKDGYTDGHDGAWIMDPPVFSYAFQSYWDAGYQIHIHNNGDAGLDVLLDNLDKAMQRNPRQDHRTVIVHFGFATTEQVARAGKLSAIVSANPYYVTALAGRYAKLGIGPERSKNMVPLGDVVKNGMSLSFHSDMPMAPAKPLQLMWAAVNRLTAEGQVAGPEHKVSLDVALRAMTIDAAFSIQLENEVGSIEVGKMANLTILQENPYAVPPTKIKDIAVWGTMLEGRVQPAPAAPKSASRNSPVRLGACNSAIVNVLANEGSHHHSEEGCCACAMSRAFANAMALRSR